MGLAARSREHQTRLVKKSVCNFHGVHVLCRLVLKSGHHPAELNWYGTISTYYLVGTSYLYGVLGTQVVLTRLA